jgi:Rho guanine nucleotide exchange factor 11
MELAHRELLKSLGGESSGGATPMGNLHTEAVRWKDSSLSPAPKEALASGSQNSNELGTCLEDGE